MNATHHILLRQIVDEVEDLPENLISEVLDFIGYLHTKYERKTMGDGTKTLSSTFGSWEDEREPEEIVKDIDSHRTMSVKEPGL